MWSELKNITENRVISVIFEVSTLEPHTDFSGLLFSSMFLLFILWFALFINFKSALNLFWSPWIRFNDVERFDLVLRVSVLILFSVSSDSPFCCAATCFLTFGYLFIKSSPSQKDNLQGNIADRREVKWKEVWKGRPTLFKKCNTKIIPTLPILFKQFSLQEVFSPLLNIYFLIFSFSQHLAEIMKLMKLKVVNQPSTYLGHCLSSIKKQ